MSSNSFKWTAVTLVLVGCMLILSTSAVAQSGCVRFDGIDHCPFGDTTLSLDSDGSRLLVTGLDPKGNEGVASLFKQTYEWRAELTPTGKNPGNRVVFNAISEGSLAARATLTYTSVDVLSIQANFTGGTGTYSAYVMSGGNVVAEDDDLGDLSDIILRPWPRLPEPFPVPLPWPFPDTRFPQLASGACVYEFSFQGQIAVTLSNGKEVIGDAIRLVEDVGGPGGYPYAGFESMVIQANGDALEITREDISQ